jgi:hypothetical protein
VVLIESHIAPTGKEVKGIFGISIYRIQFADQSCVLYIDLDLVIVDATDL